MLEVTAIKPQKRQGRFNIFIDGKYSFSLDSFSLGKSGIYVGKVFSDAELENFIKEGQLQKNLEKVMNFLSFRPRSRKELQEYLMRRKVDEENRNLVLEKVEKLGLVDDKEFARWWVEQRQTFRPKGARAIVQELRRKGVGREIIEEVKISSDKERGNAQRLLEKRWPVWLREGRLMARKRAGDFLARRGFSWEVIERAVDQAELG